MKALVITIAFGIAGALAYLYACHGYHAQAIGAVVMSISMLGIAIASAINK